MAKQQNKPKGQPFEIRAEVGLTVELNGRWYKFTFSQSNKIPANSDMVTECDSLWLDCKEEIRNQIKELSAVIKTEQKKML